MSAQLFSLAMSEIGDHYIEEAVNYQVTKRQRKVKQLFRMALAACLAIIMGLGTVLVVSAEARETVFGWVKEQYESFAHYEYHDEKENDVSDTEISAGFVPYGLTELPPGYTELDGICDEELGQQFTVYWNEEKGYQCVVSVVVGNGSTGDVFMQSEGYTLQPVTVAGVTGELYIPDDPAKDGGIVWSKENRFFYIIGHFTQEEFIYYAERLQPISVQNEGLVHYRLGHIPEGYTFLTENQSPHDYTVIYSNEAGLTISFFYIGDPDGAEVFIKDGQTKTTAMIHGVEAELQLSDDLSKESSSIVWVEDDVLFYIAAFLPQDELISLAESVEEVPASEMEGTT